MLIMSLLASSSASSWHGGMRHYITRPGLAKAELWTEQALIMQLSSTFTFSWQLSAKAEVNNTIAFLLTILPWKRDKPKNLEQNLRLDARRMRVGNSQKLGCYSLGHIRFPSGAELWLLLNAHGNATVVMLSCISLNTPHGLFRSRVGSPIPPCIRRSVSARMNVVHVTVRWGIRTQAKKTEENLRAGRSGGGLQ